MKLLYHIFLFIFILLTFKSQGQSCNNVDFENNTASGWIITEATNVNSLTQAGCCSTTSNRYSIVGAGADPFVPALAKVPPGAGNFTLRLGDGPITGAKVVRAKQSFMVSSSNPIFLYKFAVVLEDGSHVCSTQPYFNISFTDASNATLPCGSYNIVQSGSSCAGGDPSFILSGIYYYRNWETRAVDLTPYIGQIITIEFTAGDCVDGGHASWAYIDCSCVPLTLNLNGTKIVNGSTNTTCSTSTNTLCADAGFASYSWTGPAGATGQTGQCIVTNTLGTYSVLLSVTGSGCFSPTLNTTFTTTPNPTSNFNFTATPCVNTFTVPFMDNSSTNGGYALTNYYWDFDNNGVTDNTSSNTIYTFLGPGTYSVELKVSNGLCLDSITKSITLTQPPIADFNFTNGCVRSALDFTSTSSPTLNLGNEIWNWNDGTSNGTGPVSNHVFLTDGIKTVNLTVTNTLTSCTSTVSKSITVFPSPIISFSAKPVCLGTTTSFTNSTTIVLPYNISFYGWDFDNNGVTDNAALTPVKTFTSAGIYSVELKATSSNGCSDSLVVPVLIFSNPTASFTADSACFGSVTQLQDVSNGNGSPVTGYAWDYLSDGTLDATTANPSFVFPLIGNNPITYTASTSPAPGLTCSRVTSTINVFVNPNPTPDFSFINKCINAQPNTFDASLSALTVGTNSVYTWAFGDGGVNGNGMLTTHVYTTAGVYMTTLTVISNKVCQKSISKQVEVYQKPLVNIAVSSACFMSTTSFTSVTMPGSGTITNWNWDFNNIINTYEGSGQIVSYQFPIAGNNNVNLICTTNNNCKGTTPYVLYVNYLPKPSFSVDLPSGCSEHCVVFTDQTPLLTLPGVNTTWQWVFGDGNFNTINTNASQNHCYQNYSTNQVQNYDVKLIITTNKGCKDSITKLAYVKVFPTPIVEYSVDPNPGNILLTPTQQFINHSVDYIKWWWYYGDSPYADSISIKPIHTYYNSDPASYFTSLIVANQYGCKNKKSIIVDIGTEFVFYVPDAFTPSNRDDINDLFNGMGYGITDYQMWIYNRWGSLIFYTDDIKKGWDGKKQGEDNFVELDVYVWEVKLKDVLGNNHEYLGTVTVLK